MKMRNDAIAARAITDPETYEAQTKLGMEIADVVRRNIVQGVKVPNPENELAGKDTFSECSLNRKGPNQPAPSQGYVSRKTQN